MKLEGHQAAVHSMKFAPNGVYLATAGFDKLIYIWEVFGECPHVLTLTGHKNSVQARQNKLDWVLDFLYIMLFYNRAVAIVDCRRYNSLQTRRQFTVLLPIPL